MHELINGTGKGYERVEEPQANHSHLMFVIASFVVTLAIAAWLHSIRTDVATFDSVRIFLSLVLFQDYPAALLMAAVTPLALIPALRRLGLSVTRYAGHHPWQLFLLTVCALSVGASVVYHAHPLAMDEYAAVFQSQVFAAGRMYGHWPPEMIDWLLPRGFQGYFLAVSHQTGHVASLYWPGFALLLAPFTKVGLTWLANPVLGGLAVLLVHRIALRLTGSIDAAGLAALLTVASPAVTINAVSLYSMTAHLVCNAAFVLLLLQPTFWRVVSAGLVGSLALTLHNPVPHILVAAPWLLWLCARRDRWRLVPGIVIGYAPLSILLGLGWSQVLTQLVWVASPQSEVATSREWLAGVIDRLSAAAAIFRMPDLGALEDRLMATAKIWIWAVPGLGLLSVAGAWRSGAEIRSRLLSWSAVSTLLGFLFVPVDQGHGWGFRYFHAAWFTLPVLAVLAIWPTRSAVPSQSHSNPTSEKLAGAIAASALLSLTFMTAVHALLVESFVATHLAQMPSAPNGSPQVVFVGSQNGYYVGDLVQNDPFLRTRPIIVVSHGDKKDAALLAEHFADLEILAIGPNGSVWGYPEL